MSANRKSKRLVFRPMEPYQRFSLGRASLASHPKRPAQVYTEVDEGRRASLRAASEGNRTSWRRSDGGRESASKRTDFARSGRQYRLREGRPRLEGKYDAARGRGYPPRER